MPSHTPSERRKRALERLRGKVSEGPSVLVGIKSEEREAKPKESEEFDELDSIVKSLEHLAEVETDDRRKRLFQAIGILKGIKKELKGEEE